MLFLVDILPVDDHPHGLVEGQNKDARYDAQPVIILAVLRDHEFIAQAAHALAVGPQNPVRRKGGQIATAVLFPDLPGRDMPQGLLEGRVAGNAQPLEIMTGFLAVRPVAGDVHLIDAFVQALGGLSDQLLVFQAPFHAFLAEPGVPVPAVRQEQKAHQQQPAAPRHKQNELGVVVHGDRRRFAGTEQGMREREKGHARKRQKQQNKQRPTVCPQPCAESFQDDALFMMPCGDPGGHVSRKELRQRRIRKTAPRIMPQQRPKPAAGRGEFRSGKAAFPSAAT